MSCQATAFWPSNHHRDRMEVEVTCTVDIKPYSADTVTTHAHSLTHYWWLKMCHRICSNVPAKAGKKKTCKLANMDGNNEGLT